MNNTTTIIVTGATGFIGSRMVERLVAYRNQYSNIHIIATGRRNINKTSFLYQNVEYIQGDLTQPKFVQYLLSDATIVIHCAALCAPWGKWSDFYNSNVLSTKLLLEESLYMRVQRFIFLSSSSVYFNYQHRFNIRENAPLYPRMLSNYSKSKLMAENIVQETHKRGLSTIILRPKTVLGRGDTTIIPRLLKAHEAGKLKIIGSGNSLSSLIEVGDLTESIIKSMEVGEAASGKIFNIANEQPISVSALLKMVFEELERPISFGKVAWLTAHAAAVFSEMKAFLAGTVPPLSRYMVNAMYFSQTLNTDLAQALLGFQPQRSHQEMIREFTDWWEEEKKEVTY